MPTPKQPEKRSGLRPPRQALGRALLHRRPSVRRLVDLSRCHPPLSWVTCARKHARLPLALSIARRNCSAR
jgi:hypothetical protein